MNLLGSGTILQQVLLAGQRLAEDYDVAARVFSVTSFTELARDGASTERWNLLNPAEKPKRGVCWQCFGRECTDSRGD